MIRGLLALAGLGVLVFCAWYAATHDPPCMEWRDFSVGNETLGAKGQYCVR